MNPPDNPTALPRVRQGEGEAAPLLPERLLECDVRLTDAVLQSKPGAVPGGFEGVWCNPTRVREHCAIMNLEEST